MSTRLERLREYKRMVGPKGEANSVANLEYWSERASANSQIAPRATNKPQAMAVGTSDGVAPKRHEGDMRAQAKADKNDIGSSFMPGVRRSES